MAEMRASKDEGSLDDDLISCLPDDALGAIISLLPTKAGARTQLLSRRWRPLWRSPMAPLILVSNNRLSESSWTRARLVSRILSDHPGPARRFSILFPFYAGRMGEVDGWLSSGTLAVLQELGVTNERVTKYPLPQQVLPRFAPTLRVLELSGCRIPDQAAPPSFPHLKQLILDHVGISEGSLQTMISGCAVLECFLLHAMTLGRLRISSPTLRSISFYAHHAESFQELVIDEAPCLERLVPLRPDDGPTTNRVIRAPKLEMLGLLSQAISTLCLGTIVFQKMIAISLTTKMHTMKILVLDPIGPNLGVAIDFLKCFPCLEKLYVIWHTGEEMNNVLEYDPVEQVECLELHLNVVVLKNYYGDERPFIDFAKFFILNAKVLKEMEIGVRNYRNDEWMCWQHRELQLENRASQDARIELTKNNPREFSPDHVHIHDMSMTDPFERSLCGCSVGFR